VNWPRYPAHRLGQARAAAQAGRVVLQESFSRGSAGWLLGPDATTLSAAARLAGITQTLSRHPGDGRGCIELYAEDLGRAYSRAGPPEERPTSWSIFSASQELEAVKNALDGNISVWVDSAKDTRWLLFGPTEGMVRQARDTVKGRGNVARREPAWATLLNRSAFDRARSRCLSAADLAIVRSGTMGFVAPVRRPIMAAESSGPLVLERLRQRVASRLQQSRPSKIVFPATSWSASVILGIAFSSNLTEGASFHIHLPGPWSDGGRCWVGDDLNSDYSFFTNYLCADPREQVGLALDIGITHGIEVSQHSSYEDAVSAATQEAGSLLVVGQKSPPDYVVTEGACLASFAWRKAAAAEREWVELADFVKATD